MTHPYRVFNNNNVPITAMSEEERDQRISDLVERGFEVVSTFEKELDSHEWYDSGYKPGSRFRHKGSVYSKKYCAVMRKVNNG